MDTEVKDELRETTDTTAVATEQSHELASHELSTQDARGADPREEIEELLRIKRSRRLDGGRLPCPSCGLGIEMTINRCPFCESDIAAETALARETTRRLYEISGQLEIEHAARTDEKPKRPGFFQRLRYVFEGVPEPSLLDSPAIDPHARRLLSMVSPGDTLKVLSEDGPWLEVKTSAGVVGWVYSTVRKNS